MSIRAILTTLILGSSTVALAQPGEWYPRDDGWRQEWRNPYDRDGAYRGNPYGDWSGYGNSEVRVLGPRHLGRRLDVNTSGGRLSGLSMLRIEPRGRGRTFVDRVTLVYADRPPRSLHLDRWIDADDQAIEIPLGDSDDVLRVIITGGSDRGAAIVIDAV